MSARSDAELIMLRGQVLEYKLTLQVLAVLVERLAALAKTRWLVIDDVDLALPPDLFAERHPELKQIWLRTER